ncbi:MAG: DUF4340 domain-containing protein [Firmicutes bacterium]|nr:DUF4340 domain-containing protein [[Eubacterium] siraeum]MCM1486972.1 DUF4340 domain-containing protein [Bacillota bacterium]
MKISTKQTILFSLIGVAVLAAVTVVLTLTAPKSADEDSAAETTTADPRLVLQPEDMGAITKIEVQNPSGSFTVYSSEEDGETVWQVEGGEIAQKLLNTSAFASVENVFNSMTARSIVEENASDLSQYGLDEPTVRAKATFEAGEMTLEVGNEVPGSSSRYITVNGGKDVFTYYYTDLKAILDSDKNSFVNLVALPEYDDSTGAGISNITVKRKDWEQPLILKEIPSANEDSMQSFSYQFTSPFSLYLDFNTGDDYLTAMFGLTASKAAYINPTDEQMALTGLDDPFCQVDQIVGETLLRLYIGDAITEEVTDEATGAVTTVITGYYGISNKVPEIIYIFDPSKIIWAQMQPTDYVSSLFLMPYIYDLESVSYKDTDRSFTVNIEGDQETAKFTVNGKAADSQLTRDFYQYLIGCQGKTVYTDEKRGDFIAEFTYTYRDKDRGSDTVTLYQSESRDVIIAVNGQNIFTTAWGYQSRLLENAEAYLKGEAIIQNY